MSTTQELQSFCEFAEVRLRNAGCSSTLDDLYAEWRALHPSQAEIDQDVLAVRASLRDMENGETGRPFDEFAAEFRKRNGI